MNTRYLISDLHDLPFIWKWILKFSDCSVKENILISFLYLPCQALLSYYLDSIRSSLVLLVFLKNWGIAFSASSCMTYLLSHQSVYWIYLLFPFNPDFSGWAFYLLILIINCAKYILIIAYYFWSSFVKSAANWILISRCNCRRYLQQLIGQKLFHSTWSANMISVVSYSKLKLQTNCSRSSDDQSLSPHAVKTVFYYF